MKILLVLKDVGYEPRVFDTVVSPEDMDYQGEYGITDRVKVKISVQRTNIGYKLKIYGRTRMRFVCSRCLDTFDRDFVFRDETILRKGEVEHEHLSDIDVETIYIAKDEVDVMPILRDIFITSLPINPLCSGDCKGICIYCGEKIIKEPHKHVERSRKLGDILASVKKEVEK